MQPRPRFAIVSVMLSLYVALAIVTVLDLVLCFPLGKLRPQLAAILNLSSIVAAGILLHDDVNAFSVLYAVLTAYKICNYIRILQGRRQADYLFTISRRSSWVLAVSQLALLGLAYGLLRLHPAVAVMPSIAAANLVVAAVVTLVALRQLIKTRPPKLVEPFPPSQLPSLTVAIPARNETDSLEACLQSLIQSDYPKLEILVLDDCSQNKRTPQLIKSFAQDGVRFIAGKPAPEAWLAKNFAYQQLADAASGSLLLFCGVDTRFEKQTLRLLVADMLEKKKTMISLIPANQVPPAGEFESLLVQPSRYAWELLLPRLWTSRPPVLSTCWIISQQVLEDAGGFAAVARNITPERYLAKHAALQNDGYSFMQSATTTGLTSHKPFDDQQATAIRSKYPQLHQRLEYAAFVTLLEIGLFVLPFVLGLGALATGYWLVAALSGASLVLLTFIYVQIMAVTYRRFLWRSLWLLPFAALYDVAILNYSLYKYEFDTVMWKDRNVCIPVMRVIPTLPPA
ncbi:MAG: hypothetical protein JWN38_297 [Candidatus Saccharibacteria bacterium]|nr:hypothetical protein [Candidatus Saccharibacteria bacterium]